MLSFAAIEQNANLDVKTLYATGTVLQQQGKIAAAIDSYQQAISCWKNNPEPALLPWVANACSNWGCILVQEGKFDEAVAVFQAGIAIAPDDAPLYNNLGIVLLELQKPEQAIAIYRRAIELDSELVLARYNLGRAFQQLGFHNFAGDCFELVIKQQPDRVWVWGDLAVSLMARGKLAEAMLCLQRSISLQNEFVAGFCRLVEMRLNSTAEINELDRAQLACVRFLRQLQGKDRSGCSIVNLASNSLHLPSLLLNLAETFWHMGNVLAEYGGYEQAEIYYQKALQIQPKNTNIYLRLADCLARQQRWAAAIVIYRMAIAIAGERSDISEALQGVLKQQRKLQLNPTIRRELNHHPEARQGLNHQQTIRQELNHQSTIRRGINSPSHSESRRSPTEEVQIRHGLQHQPEARQELNHQPTIRRGINSPSHSESRLKTTEKVAANSTLMEGTTGTRQCRVPTIPNDGRDTALPCPTMLFDRANLLEKNQELTSPRPRTFAMRQGFKPLPDLPECGLDFGPNFGMNAQSQLTQNISFASENKPQKSECGGLDCQRCLRRIFQQFEPVNLGENLYACNGKGETAVESPETFVTVLPKGRAWIVPQKNSWMICNAIAIIDAQNRLVPELSREYPGELPGCTKQHSISHRFLNLQPEELPPLEQIDGTVAVLAGLSGNVYFHWMVDVLPRIEILQRWGVNLEEIDWFVVNSCQQSFQRETLKALGIPEYKIIESDRHPYIQAEKLIVPSFAGYLGWLSPRGLEFLRQVFLTGKSRQFPADFASEIPGFDRQLRVSTKTTDLSLESHCRVRTAHLTPPDSGRVRTAHLTSLPAESTPPDSCRVRTAHLTPPPAETTPPDSCRVRSAHLTSPETNYFPQKNSVSESDRANSIYPERIYISRSKCSYRQVINEDRVIEILSGFGFVSVLLESMTFGEQIALFSRAKVIVAPHGSGLTNIIFCSPGTKVIELTSPNYIRHYYWAIGQQLDLAHYYITGESFDCYPLRQLMYQNPLTEDILVNLTSLKNMMVEMNLVPSKKSLNLNLSISPKNRSAVMNQESADYFHKRAEFYLAQGKLSDALTACEQALKHQSDFAPACNTLGKICQAQGNLSQAKQWYTKALELQPNLPEVYTNLSVLYAQEKNWEMALLCHQKLSAVPPQNPVNHQNNNNNVQNVLALNPDDIEVYIQGAESFYAQRKYEQSAAACLRVIQVKPEARVYKILGNARQAQGRMDEAKNCYGKAIELDPDYAEAYTNLGTLYAQEQQWQSAIAFYQKAIALQPNLASSYRNLARVRTQMGELAEADECWFKAYSLEPDKATPEEHINLGDSFLKQNQVTQAIRCYCHAIELNPNSNEAYHSLGNALKVQKRLQEEAANYRKIIERPANIFGDLFKTVVVSLNAKSELPEKLQKPALRGNEAANSLAVEQPISAPEKPHDLPQQQTAVPQQLNAIAPATNSIDVLSQVMGTNSGFTEDFQQQETAQANSSFPADFWQQEGAANCIQKAEAYCAKEQFDRALVECQRAIEIQPESVVAWKLRGNILQEQGNLAGA
ncbi:MAG: tetratricopeptide repeat protein, partial [Microcoleus sp.]